MFLTHSFKKAALKSIVVLAFVGGIGADKASAQPSPDDVYPCSEENHTPDKVHPFTPGEIQLVRSIFGNTVQTAGVSKYFVGSAPSYSLDLFHDIHAVTCLDKKSIEFFGTDMASDDYSREIRILPYTTFIHEMTHIWQAQNNITWVDFGKNYNYTLDAKRRFTDYGDEQQGLIVGDYARHFFRHEKTLQSPGNQTPEQFFTLLAKLVEDQFPEAKKTRLALEAKEKAEKPQIASVLPAPNLR